MVCQTCPYWNVEETCLSSWDKTSYRHLGAITRKLVISNVKEALHFERHGSFVLFQLVQNISTTGAWNLIVSTLILIAVEDDVTCSQTLKKKIHHG
jgi:hypothetical protein